MALTVSCPHCEVVLNLADDLAGLKVRCKRCGHVFTVEATGAAPDPGQLQPVAQKLRRPASAEVKRPVMAYDEDDEEDEEDDRPRRRRERVEPKKSGTGLVLILLGVAAAFFLLIAAGLGVGIYLYARARAEQEARAAEAALQAERAAREALARANQAVPAPPAGMPFGAPGEADRQRIQQEMDKVHDEMKKMIDDIPAFAGANPADMDAAMRRHEARVREMMDRMQKMQPGFPPGGPPPGFGQPAAPFAVTLSNGKVTRRPGLRASWSLDFKIDQGQVNPLNRYFWVIKSRSGKTYEQLLFWPHLQRGPGQLAGSAFAVGNDEGPFETYLEEEAFGPQRSRRKLSNTLAMP